MLIVVGISLAIAASELNESKPDLSAMELAHQISTPTAGAVWGVECGLLVALTYVCRLPQGKKEPELSITRFAFVARAATSATLGVLCVAIDLAFSPFILLSYRLRSHLGSPHQRPC